MIYVALLRGVNVGGRQIVPMAGLRDMFTRLGFANPRTLLQSGNVVFESGAKKAAALERLLEAETTKAFGLTVDYTIRTAGELDQIVSANPFPKEARADPSHLLVMFCKSAIDAKAVKSVEALIVGRERVHADGAQLYIVYPDGIGRSKLVGTTIEKVLATRGTARNWNTVTKLQAIAGSAEAGHHRETPPGRR